jgi:hypothetical protein
LLDDLDIGPTSITATDPIVEDHQPFPDWDLMNADIEWSSTAVDDIDSRNPQANDDLAIRATDHQGSATDQESDPPYARQGWIHGLVSHFGNAQNSHSATVVD